MPTMSGSFCRAAVTISAAVEGSLWEYCTPTDSNLLSFATASSKPCARASVVETPGSVDTTRTLPPLGLAFWIASNAAAPPPSLSLEICDTAPEGSSRVVSTRTTLIPAASAAAMGACMADTSVGAMSSASGWEATTASTMGFCRVGSNFSGPWVVTVAPSFSASAWMPHCMEM